MAARATFRPRSGARTTAGWTRAAPSTSPFGSWTLGLDEVCFGDTIGVGVPGQVAALTGLAVDAGIPLERIAFHFHDTRGTALANVAAGLDAGVRCFDSSTGGTGGCPYAPGAAGNLATEDLVYFLDASGWEHGVSLDGVLAAARFISDGDRPAPRDEGRPGRRLEPGRLMDRDARTAAAIDSRVLPPGARVQALLDKAYERFRSDDAGEPASHYPAWPRSRATCSGWRWPGSMARSTRSRRRRSSVHDHERGQAVRARPGLPGDRDRRGASRAIGVNSTGLPFDSIMAVELHPDRLSNPMVNTGALATTSLVPGATAGSEVANRSRTACRASRAGTSVTAVLDVAR